MRDTQTINPNGKRLRVDVLVNFRRKAAAPSPTPDAEVRFLYHLVWLRLG